MAEERRHNHYDLITHYRDYLIKEGATNVIDLDTIWTEQITRLAQSDLRHPGMGRQHGPLGPERAANEQAFLRLGRMVSPSLAGTRDFARRDGTARDPSENSLSVAL